jgi:hypothetical protein
MTTSIHQGDLDNIFEGYARSTFYLAALKPKTLWTAVVTSAAARGTSAITFDTGSGLDFSAIEALQTVWVGTSSGKKDLAVLRIRSISSGDSGVTGTVNVAWHGYGFGPGAFLTFVHDYPIAAKYPWLGQTGVQGTTEVFYKDVFDTYNDQTKASNIKPVVDVDISHRAGFLENGEQTFWVDASPSYSMISGVTITSYALSVYPTTGVTVTFNTSTGLGYVTVTDATEDYYWLKFTVTDSNANTRVLYMCVFSFDPDEANNNYPIKDFEVGQFTDDWETGGLTTRITMHAELTQIFTGDRPSVDMIDTAFAVLWKETVMGRKFAEHRSIPRVRSDNHLYVNPDITVSVSESATCDIDTTFVSGVRIDGSVPLDSTIIGLHVQINAETPVAVNGTVTDGVVTATAPTINAPIGACSGGTLKWLYSGNIIAQTEVWSGKEYTGSTIYPSEFLAYPFNMLVGYLRENEVNEDTEKASGVHDYELSSGDTILKNNYMYSIPIDSRQNQTKWWHYHSNMTTAEAAMFVMDFHSNVLNTVPVVGLDKDTDLRAYGEFQGQNLYTMIDGIVRHEGIRAHFKFDRHGKMHLVYDVQLLTDSERAALPADNDVDISYRSGELAISEKPEPNVALVYGSGIYWDGSFNGDGKVGNDEVEAYCSLAPWYIPNWGGGAATTNFERQTVRSQAHMNELTGRSYAKINNPFPRIAHAWFGDFLGLLNMHFEEFWTITIQTTDNPKNLVFSNENIILRSIECTIDVPNGTMTINTTWEPEAAGLDGVTAVCPDIEIDIGGLPPFDWSETNLLPGTIITVS